MKCSIARECGLRALCVFMGLATACGLSEIVCRLYKPSPGVQIAGARRGLDFWIEEGVPLWRNHKRREQYNESCPRQHPAAARIEIFGPSIFWGSGLEDSEPSFSERLQKKLDVAAPGAFCVMNFSQPGFHYDQSAALARKLIPRYTPALVLWSIWGSEPYHYSVLGDRAYDLTQFPIGSDGYPRALPLPLFLNRLLFRNSRLYEYATLKLLRIRSSALDSRPFWAHFARHDLHQIVQLSRRCGATLVPVFCPILDRPFADWMSAPDPATYLPEVGAAIRREQIPEIRLGDILAGQDYLRLRFDSHGHYNDAGHEALAEVFFRWIMDRPALLKRSRSSEKAARAQRDIYYFA